MRLLHVDSLQFAEFRNEETRPRYVVASHRWAEGSEALLKDVQTRTNTQSRGYKKIEAFAQYVRERIPSIYWLWIDTCCINQDSAAELSEATNSMFRWYRDAELCLAYLADVDSVDDKRALRQSDWFRRGWTLQELLAPRTVVFLTKTWQVIGNKGASSRGYDTTAVGVGLEREVAMITGISEQILHDYGESNVLAVDEKFKWMEGRETSREEDMSYALFGIFGVTPGANYGEGREGARRRLSAAIHQHDDQAAQVKAQWSKIEAWLLPPDTWTNHEMARQRHEAQTGTWLLLSPKYQAWKAGALRHLWVYGKAGCGKTILCSTAIEDIRKHCDGRSSAGCAFFYFSFSDNRKQSTKDLLLSLVVQLGWEEPGLSMLQQAYETRNPSNRLGQGDLETILLAIVDTYDEMYLLIDALDECPEGGDVRQETLELLARLSRRAPALRVLATSRELPEIRESMDTFDAASMPIPNDSVDNDIRRFVSTQLSRNQRLSRLDAATKTKIEETISTKADGMFRWADCQLQELKKLKSTKPKFIKEALHSLPATLDATYERILTAIDEIFREDALTLLRWLAYARSPLSLRELVDATIIDTENGSVEIENRGGLEDTLDILSGLVTIQEEAIDHNVETFKGRGLDNPASMNAEYRSSYDRKWVFKEPKVKLAHFSVKRYLESTRILQSDARGFHLQSSREHRVLAQSCMTYITYYSGSDEKSSTEKDLETFPLLQYAVNSWPYHSARQQSGDVTREVSLLNSPAIKHDWLLIGHPDQSWKRPFHSLIDVGSGLYYASFLGLQEVVRALLAAKVDCDAQGGYHGNALQAAAYEGHENIVLMLMAAGANLDTHAGEHANALQAASSGGYEKLVQTLIRAGSNVNSQGGYYGNALQAAAVDGTEKVTRMLLDAGADVHAQGGRYGNALQAASIRGYEKVVSMLLDAGADVNIEGGEYGHALQAASSGGHEKVAKMLIEAGADINALGGDYGNAIRAAIVEGHEKIVQLLLESGADARPMARDQLGRSLLHISASCDSCAGVRFALDAGQDVNEVDHHNWNSLHWAAYFGSTDVLRFLLDQGADDTARDWQSWTPEQVAAFSGNTTAADILSGLHQEQHIDKQIHRPRPGKAFRGVCDSCNHNLVEIHHHCSTCPTQPGYDLCFRCFRDAEFVHPRHVFTTDFRYNY